MRNLMRSVSWLLVLSIGFGGWFGGSLARAEGSAEAPVYPTWKLLGPEAKKYFVAGYVYGHREARALGEVAVTFAQQNPTNAAAGLERILPLYRLTEDSPTTLVPKIDEYLKNPANQEQSLRFIINRLQDGQ